VTASIVLDSSTDVMVLDELQKMRGMKRTDTHIVAEV
jgi:hypothetical protein